MSGPCSLASVNAQAATPPLGSCHDEALRPAALTTHTDIASAACSNAKAPHTTQRMPPPDAAHGRRLAPCAPLCRACRVDAPEARELHRHRLEARVLRARRRAHVAVAVRQQRAHRRVQALQLLHALRQADAALHGYEERGRGEAHVDDGVEAAVEAGREEVLREEGGGEGVDGVQRDARKGGARRVRAPARKLTQHTREHLRGARSVHQSQVAALRYTKQ